MLAAPTGASRGEGLPYGQHLVPRGGAVTYFGTRVMRSDSIGESVSQARLPFGEEITSSVREINPRKVKTGSINP